MGIIQIYSRTNWPLTDYAVGPWVDWITDKCTVETFTVSNGNPEAVFIELQIVTGGTASTAILPRTEVPPMSSIVLNIQSCVLQDDQKIQAKSDGTDVDFLASGSVFLVKGSGKDPVTDDGAFNYNRIQSNETWLLESALDTFSTRVRKENPTLTRGYKANTDVVTEFKLEADSYPVGYNSLPVWYDPNTGKPDNEVVSFWTEMYFSIDGGELSYRIFYGRDGSHISLEEIGSNRYRLVLADSNGVELKSPSFDMESGRPMCLFFTVSQDYALEAHIYEQDHSGNEYPLRVRSMYWRIGYEYLEAEIFKNPKLLIDFIGTDSPGLNWIAIRGKTWLTDWNMQLTAAHDIVAREARQLYDIYGSQAHVEFGINHLATNWGELSHDV